MAKPAGTSDIVRSEQGGDEVRATLVEHLEELRTRIIRAVTILAAGWVIGFIIQPYVYEFVARPLFEFRDQDKPIQLVFTNFASAFFLKFQLGLVIGLILTAPFLLSQLWGFVRPGLTKQERRIVRLITPASIALFFFGVALCWYILPRAFQFFLGYLDDFGDAELLQDPKMYVFFVLKMLLAFGVGFQMPIVLVVLGKLEIITEEFLWQYWRQAMVAMAVAAMVLTPSGDIFSMMTLLVPLSLLYFGSIGVMRLFTRKKKAAEVASTSNGR